MCGLVGVYGTINFVEEKVFKTLLTLDVIRGKHSTGVAGWSLANGFRVAKAGLNAIDYMDKAEFTAVMAPLNKILMGHNRHATVGAINDQNAHPFEFENVIGAHNGSLNPSWRQFHAAANCNVDSEALYSEMSENGPATLWGKLDGPAALTWIDKADKSVHFLRNAARPLFYVTANKGTTLLWASEDWMLIIAAGREGLKLDGKISELPIHTHLTFNLPEKFGGQITQTTEKLAPYVAPKVSYTGGYYGYGNGNQSGRSTTPSATEVAAKKHLEKEGLAVGDMVEFTVEVLRDYYSSGAPKVNVLGCTVGGTPIRIMAMDTGYYAQVVDTMSELAEGVFAGKIAGTIESGLTLVHNSIQLVANSMADWLMAIEEESQLDDLAEQANKDCKLEGAPRNVIDAEAEKREQLAAARDETEKLRQAIENRYGEDNKHQDDPLKSPVIINYSVACNTCRKLTRAYHLLDGQRMCITCAKKFVESSKKALEMRNLH